MHLEVCIHRVFSTGKDFQTKAPRVQRSPFSLPSCSVLWRSARLLHPFLTFKIKVSPTDLLNQRDLFCFPSPFHLKSMHFYTLQQSLQVIDLFYYYQKKIHFLALLLFLLQIHSNYLILYHNQRLRHQHCSTVASCSINTFANGVVCKLQWSIKYTENIVGVTVLHLTLIPPKHRQTGWSWFAPSPAALYKPEKQGGFSPALSELQS